ncbi:hypothetical protein ACEQPO_07665 [Bacillus sp. SL00103]
MVEKVLSSPELANLEKMAPKLDQVKKDAKTFSTKLARSKEALSNRDAKSKKHYPKQFYDDEEKKGGNGSAEQPFQIELPDLSGLEQSLAGPCRNCLMQVRFNKQLHQKRKQKQVKQSA